MDVMYYVELRFIAILIDRKRHFPVDLANRRYVPVDCKE